MICLKILDIVKSDTISQICLKKSTDYLKNTLRMLHKAIKIKTYINILEVKEVNAYDYAFFYWDTLEK